MKRYICNDIWWNIFPFFANFELGLNLALLSLRFDWLVDKHFNGKTELTIWRPIFIQKDKETNEAKLSVRMDNGQLVDFPLPNCPMPNKILFKKPSIWYIDHSVIAFCRTNKQIFSKVTKFILSTGQSRRFHERPFWNVFVREMWPIFSENIRHLCFSYDFHLKKLRRRISPTVLTDLKLLNSIYALFLFPDAIADDGPKATAGQALAKWLHTPTADGQPKRLFCYDPDGIKTRKWIDGFKEAFFRATSSACYVIQIRMYVYVVSLPIEPFDLVNERTQEMLTLKRKKRKVLWLLKRCPIGETVQWEDKTLVNLNSVHFNLLGDCIGPLSASATDEGSEKSAEESPGPSGR